MELTAHEKAELTLMKLANENGKFALGIGLGTLTEELNDALERLQIREWVKLIDVNLVAHSPRERPVLCRIFMLTTPAFAWIKQHAN